MRPKRVIVAATAESIEACRVTSAASAMAMPPSPLMIAAVSSAAAWLMSMQAMRAPSRAKATAAALPLPQPSPEEPAPKTMAILPLSRSAMVDALRSVGETGRHCEEAQPTKQSRAAERFSLDCFAALAMTAEQPQLSEPPTAFSRIAQASSPYFFFHSA